MVALPPRAAGLCLAALVVSVFGGSARADGDAPIVVVVESEDGDLRASALRVAIADVGLPAYALSDDAAPTAEGTLSIAVPADGAVRLRFTDPEGHSLTRAVASRRAATLARVAVRLVREARADRSPHGREVLDPWRDGQPAAAEDMYVLAEVLDPWSGEAIPADLPPYEEVLDPWAAQPSPDDEAPAISAVTPDVLDPWAAENGRRLDSPR